MVFGIGPEESNFCGTRACGAGGSGAVGWRSGRLAGGLACGRAGRVAVWCCGGVCVVLVALCGVLWRLCAKRLRSCRAALRVYLGLVPVGHGLLAGLSRCRVRLAVLVPCLSRSCCVWGSFCSFFPEFAWVFGVGHFWRSSKTPFHCDFMD